MPWTLVGIDSDGAEHVLQTEIAVPFTHSERIVRSDYGEHRLKPGTPADADALFQAIEKVADMPAQVITFKLAHGLDSLVVIAEPYDTLAARAWDALAGRDDVEVEGVTMPYGVRQHLKMRRDIEMPNLGRDPSRYDIGLATFLGYKVTVDYADH